MLAAYQQNVFAQLTGYTSRLKAQVNSSQVSGSSDLSNFPVLVSLTNNDLRTVANGGLVENSNGYDIVFTSSNGSTLLSHQLESYNATTGELIAWVRFPTLSPTTDTEFYIHFGNSGISTDQSTVNVWDSNYKMVLHLTGDTDDYSGEGTDATDSGTSDAAGQIARSRQFGTNQGDIISVADAGVSPLDITGNITISFWVNITNRNEGPDFVTKGDYTDGYSTWVDVYGRIAYQVNNDALASGFFQLSSNVWTYLTFTRASNGDRVIYKNGAVLASDNSAASFNTNNDPLYLTTPSYPFEGRMDEVRISNVTRSADWVATEYNNQSSPGTFITLINTEPVLSNIESSTLAYNSGDSPTAITSSIIVKDGDDTNLQSATIQITSNFAAGEDQLAFVDQLGITGSYASSTGILTLTGSSSLANYQTALRSVTYENTSGSPSELTRTISFTVNDGTDDSNTRTRNISVTKVNNAPTLSNIESTSIIYYAGNGQKQISNTLEVDDIDDTTLDSAFVQISSGYVSSEDTLYFTDSYGITGSWNETTGRLKLTGSTLVSNYQNALRTVTYENVSGSPTMSTRTISFSASDGTATSSTVSRDIEYPTAISDLATYKSNGVFHYDAMDVDGDLDTGDQPGTATNLSSWGDRSDNAGGSSTDLTATQGTASDQPLFDPTYLGDRGALYFDGSTDDIDPPNDALLNTASYTEKSFAIMFRTGTSVSGLQMVYEQGGGTRGYQISIKDGNAYAFVWNNSEWGSGNQYKSIDLGTVVPNSSYIILASHDATSGTLASRVWEANINGGTVTTLTSADVQQAHAGGAMIGEENGTVDPVTLGGNPAGTNNFDGYVAEFASWNAAFSASDFTNIYGYLSEKWFNEPPVLADIEATALTYNEGDAATTITSSITVSDADDTDLDSIRVSITSGFDATEDVLAFVDMLGITGSWNGTTGILTLSGTTTLSNYQTAVRTVTYQNTDASSPSETTREISFTAYDWDGSSGAITRDIEIQGSNSAPVLSAIEGTTLAYTEGDGAVATTATIVATDSDDSNLEGATVSFINNYFLGEDELDFTDSFGITSSFDAMTGILTLTGTSTVANYQSALRSVTYENTSSDPVTSLDRTIEYRIYDGTDSSATGITRDISVASVNTAPILDDIETETIFYQSGDSSTVTETITLTDPDDTNIETATFQITTNYDSAEDTLVFTTIFGITGSWNDGTGTLTLTGPASKSDFQSALQTVMYRNTITTPTDQPRVVSITVNDGTDDSNTETRNISFSIPKSVSDLLVWLKADAGTYTTTGGTTASGNGDDVGRWEDQSGNANHFITSGATPPILQTAQSSINDQNGIEFPGGGSNVRLEDSDAETQYLSGLDELTIFFVIESDVINTDRGFWTTYTPDATGIDQYFSIRYDDTGDNGGSDDVITVGMRDLGTNPAFSLESFESAQTTVGQIVMLRWTSEENYEMYIDGVLSNPTFSQNIPTGVLTQVSTAIIGQGTQDNNTSWDGLISEMVLYGRDIDLDEQMEIEDYLSTKYGISIRTLTPATGGEAISADDANVTYTTLTGPRVQESFIGEFGTGGTFIFKAPSGFEWDTGGSAPSATVASAFGGSTDLTISLTSRSSSQITFTISGESTTNPAEITFADFRVRPTTGILPNSGNIVNLGTTGLGGATNYGTLTMVPGTQVSMEFDQQPSTSNESSTITPNVRVQLIDQYGNAVEESRVDISLALNQVSGSGSLAGTTTEQTNLFGIAEFDDINVDAIGTYTLTASSSGLTDTTSTEFDVVTAGELTQFIIQRVPSGNISDKLAGQTFNISIIAADGLQDTVTSFTGTVVVTSNCDIGVGQGTSAAFTSGVLTPKSMMITSTGTCTITATNSSGSETGTSNTFVVSPGSADASTTTITANPTIIQNDGFSTSTITVQLKDHYENNLTTSPSTIALSTTDGTLGSVTNNGDGTYSATLTSSIAAGIATISGTLNGGAINDEATVEFAEFDNVWQSQVGTVTDARNWDDNSNWSTNSVPVSGDKILIPANPSVGNEQPVISSTNTTIELISIESGASVTVSGGIHFVVTDKASGGGSITGSNTDSLSIGGDFDVSDVTLGFVILNGTTNQDVTSPNEYSNLELDNSNGADFFSNLIVNDTLKLTTGTLFMPSGTNLVSNYELYGTGTVRMQRRFQGSRGWRIISSPLDTTYGDFLDGIITQGYSGAFYSTGSNPGDTLQPNVLTYVESYAGTDNQRYRTPTSTSQKVTEGQGMFVYLFGDIPADPLYNDPLPDTLDVEGRAFRGDGAEVDFGITYTTSADSGWNLVGNPYLATIDWDDSPNWTKTNVESTIYIWDPSANGGSGEYLTWNGVTGTHPGGGLIAPFQGFWVKANGNSPVLKVKKEAKTTGGSFMRKTASTDDIQSQDTTKSKEKIAGIPILQLMVESDAGRSKRTNIMFSDEAATGKDTYDAYRLLPLSSSHIEFYTLLDDGTELAINNLPFDFDSRYFIPIQLNAYEGGDPYSGEMTIKWSGLRNIPADWVITLVDNDTGTEINVMEELSYTFFHTTKTKLYSANPRYKSSSIMKKADSKSTRFTLKISTEEIESNVPTEVYLDQNYPNPFNPSTIIPYGVDTNTNVSLIVYDILGRKVKTLVNEIKNPGKYEVTFRADNLASGVYFYRLVTDSKNIVKRFTLIK